MGRQKRQAARRRTRQAGQPRANALPARARPPSTADGNALLAALGTQVTAAAERAAFMNSAYRGPLSIDEPRYQEHAQKIRERFGVEVDCPELTYLASRRARFEHVIALQHIAPKFAELLERQRTERANLLRKRLPRMPRSYAETTALLKKQYPDAPRPLVNAAIAFEEHRERFETEAEFLRTRSQKMPRVNAKTKSGPAADLLLVSVADEVAEWTKQHPRGTGDRDWIATVRILECHGWDLGPLPQETKAGQLEDRVRKARERGRLP